MVQSVNTAAIRLVATRVLAQPRLALPASVAPTLAEVDWAALRAGGTRGERGVRFVVLDKDNTLTAPYVDALHPRVAPAVARCLAEFGRDRVAILSNSAGTRDDPGHAAARAVEAATGLPVVLHDDKKPLGFEETVRHFAARLPDGDAVDPADILVVGDRLLTDTVFGNLHGAQTLHLYQILEAAGDNRAALLMRRLENWALRRVWRAPLPGSP
mmetsp:Transcript_1954/g.6092  ORF Transcript_1954/g.6092 Transcript_1954/m.6092 type:complete len:214 (-) Transcript_1954:238-879(-)